MKDLDGACKSYRLAIKFIDVASKLTSANKNKLKMEMTKTLTFLSNTPESVRKELAKAMGTKEEAAGPQVEVKKL